MVEWGGNKIGFTEATGLDMQVEAIEYREGSSKTYSKIKMPGLHNTVTSLSSGALLKVILISIPGSTP